MGQEYVRAEDRGMTAYIQPSASHAASRDVKLLTADRLWETGQRSPDYPHIASVKSFQVSSESNIDSYSC